MSVLLFKMKEISVRYKRLEKDYIRDRASSKAGLTKFAEDDIGTRIYDLTTHRQRVLASLKNNHKVSLDGLSSLQQI